jgi:hypothetical protein
MSDVGGLHENYIYHISLFSFNILSDPIHTRSHTRRQKVKIVETSDDCRIIDIVIGSGSIGAEFGLDLRLAMIDAKNKAARLGADSIKIIGSSDVSTRAALSSPSGTVMVKALDCN